MTLHEITEEYMNVLAMAADPEVDEQVLADTLESLGLDEEIEAKADSYAKVRVELQVKQAELKAKADAIKAEADRIMDAYNKIGKNIEQLEGSLEKAMRATNKLKFKTDLFSFGIKKNPPKVIIADDVNVNNVPAEFLKFSDPTIKKDEVKRYLKEGNELGWATLVQEEKLSIK